MGKENGARPKKAPADFTTITAVRIRADRILKKRNRVIVKVENKRGEYAQATLQSVGQVARHVVRYCDYSLTKIPVAKITLRGSDEQ